MMTHVQSRAHCRLMAALALLAACACGCSWSPFAAVGVAALPAKRFDWASEFSGGWTPVKSLPDLRLPTSSKLRVTTAGIEIASIQSLKPAPQSGSGPSFSGVEYRPVVKSLSAPQATLVDAFIGEHKDELAQYLLEFALDKVGMTDNGTDSQPPIGVQLQPDQRNSLEDVMELYRRNGATREDILAAVGLARVPMKTRIFTSSASVCASFTGSASSSVSWATLRSLLGEGDVAVMYNSCPPTAARTACALVVAGAAAGNSIQRTTLVAPTKGAGLCYTQTAFVGAALCPATGRHWMDTCTPAQRSGCTTSGTMGQPLSCPHGSYADAELGSISFAEGKSLHPANCDDVPMSHLCAFSGGREGDHSVFGEVAKQMQALGKSHFCMVEVPNDAGATCPLAALTDLPLLQQHTVAAFDSISAANNQMAPTLALVMAMATALAATLLHASSPL